MIPVTSAIFLDENELFFRFVRSSGPGGQNVNKVATAAQLRFDVGSSPSLPGDVRVRLIRLAGRRITSEGVLIIEAKRFRTQEQNREDAINRLIELIRAAAVPPRPRKKTKATKASKERRLEEKKRRGKAKSLRRAAVSFD
jgi:ribosome-associated protein